MKRIKLFEIIGAIVIISLTAFAGISCAEGSNADKLAGVTWVLESYGNPDNPKAVIGDQELTLTFDDEKKTVSGSGGVNGYGGDYEADGNKLTISGVIHTLIASTNQALNDQENAFFNIMESAQSYKIDGQKLTITGTEGVLVFSEK